MKAPRFPAYLALARTPTGHLRIGVAPAISLPAPPEAERGLRLLDGHRSLTSAARDSGLSAEWLLEVLTASQREGLWRPAALGRVGLCGSAPVAASFGPVLRDGGMTVVDATDEQSAQDFEVALVIAGALAPDPLLLDRLLRNDIPHLIVCPTQHGVRVGPFVVPGATPCQRCCDLVLAGRDPHWAHLLPQLVRTPLEPAPDEIQWAAALALRHLRAYFHAQSPESAATTWELTATGVEVRHWPVHPDCGCAGVPGGEAFSPDLHPGHQHPGTMAA